MSRKWNILLMAAFVPSLLLGEESRVSFRNDVMPHLIAAGCAAGACHAKPDGQNNFQISVFGFDTLHDYQQMVLANRGRRISPFAPEESLLLKKATGAIPHEGGVRITPGSKAYQVIVEWIKQGARYQTAEDEKTLQHAEISPSPETFARGQKHQIRIHAIYSDESRSDVTHLTEYLSQNKDIAEVNAKGEITVGERFGETVIIARYMGHVNIVRVTVPFENTLPEERYASLPVHNEIDRLVYQRHRSLGILPSETCTDEEYIRRASLDIIGRLPTPQETRNFIQNQDENKRAKLVDRLLSDPNYADHWAIKWGDLIRPNPSRVGVKPVYLLDQWLRDSFRQNKPYDQMVRELLTAQGSSHEYGPVAVMRDKRDPVDASAFVSQIFLGVRLDCAKCHHHPSEKWTQDEYYQLAAFFSRLGRKGQAISAPISGEPEYFWHSGKGSISHPVTGAVMTPKPPDGPEMPYRDDRDPRADLAEWMAEKNNPFFAKAIVNRIWSHFLGRGLVDPVDDQRISNPPTNAPLLDWLANHFVEEGYDLKKLIRTIANSHTYQLSANTNEYNLTDTQNYSRFLKRRVSAEVLLDAINDVTGIKDAFGGMPQGSRAIQTWNFKLDSDFMDAFGRPNASEECPCERDRKSSVVQALHLMNSNSLQNKLSDPKSRVQTIAQSDLPPEKLIEEIYLAAYSRLPTQEERGIALKYFNAPELGRAQALEDLTWSLINSAEFVFNH